MQFPRLPGYPPFSHYSARKLETKVGSGKARHKKKEEKKIKRRGIDTLHEKVARRERNQQKWRRILGEENPRL